MNVRQGSIQHGFLFLIALVLLGGCTGQATDWDWFGMNKSSKDNRPVTKARRPVQEPAVAAADKPPAASPRTATPQDDAKAKDVDEKVERYVQSMNNSYDPNYESNDFRAKVRRQNDPARPERIRQTAAMSREGSRNFDDPPPVDGSSGTAKPSPSETDVKPDAVRAGQEEPMSDAASLTHSGSTNAAKSGPSFPPTAQNESPVEEKNPPSTVANPHDPQSNEAVSSKESSHGKQVQQDSPTVAKPPVLKEISVSAGEAPREKTVESPVRAEPTPAPQPEPIIIDTFKKRIEEQETLAAKDVNNIVEQFKLRLLYLADGQDDKALTAPAGMNADLAQIMLAQMRSLLSARASAERDPALWANKQMESIEQLRSLIRSRADLSVPKVALCREIISFGQFTPFEPAEFKAGVPNRVALYVEIDNFSMERTSSGMYRVLVSMRQSLLRKSGEELWSKRDDNIEDLSRRPRRDFYLTAEHVIPKTLEPGDYLFKVEVEDVLAGKINGNTVSFKLVP